MTRKALLLTLGLASYVNAYEALNDKYLIPMFSKETAKYKLVALTEEDGTKTVNFIRNNEYSSDKGKIIIYCNKTDTKQKLGLISYIRHFRRFKEVQDLIEIYSDEYAIPKWYLSTLLYNESKFNPKARSWTGVKGIAQITKATRKQYGIGSSTESQIKGMAKILRHHIDNLPDYYTDEEKYKLSALIYNRGKGGYFESKRTLLAKGIPLSYENIMSQISKTHRMKEGIEYVKRLIEHRHMFGYTKNKG